MSVGPMSGVLGSAAGAPLSQTKGSETDRNAQEASNQSRRATNEQKADNAAGIAETDGEGHDPHERDADGRRLWEGPPGAPAAEETTDGETSGASRQSKDATGDTGGSLDLTG